MTHEEEEQVRQIIDKHRDGAVEAARRGDPEHLISQVLSGEQLTAAERDFIAEHLATLKSDRGTRQYNLEMALAIKAAYWERKGEKREAFIQWAMERYGLSRASVWRILRDAKENLHAKEWQEFIFASNI